MTIAGQANTLIYGFDNANRLTSLTQGSVAVGWSYDAANRFTGVTLPNGVASVVTPDAANEITTIAYSKGSTAIANIAYSYDGDGHVSGASGSMVRPLMDAGLSGTSYDAGNHLTALATGALAYDADGNLQTQAGAGTASYTWNDRNQLIGTSNGTVLAYDALGRLVGRTQSGATTAFMYDGANQVAVNGNIMLRGANFDEVETQVTSTGTINYLTDGLGSTSMLTDSTGNVTTLYSYGAYGATAITGLSGAATVDTPFKYTGADYNSVDDLYYFRNRYYSPHLQRFISDDPSGLDGGINTYEYAGGNPLSYVDPLGLWSMAIGAYAGIGSEIIFGSENGHRFLTARLGFGKGIVAEFDRNGGVPGGTELTDCHSGLVLSGSIKGGVGFGPFFNAAGEFGAFNNVFADVQNWYHEGHTGVLDLNREGIKANEGFHFSFSGGVQVTAYSRSHE